MEKEYVGYVETRPFANGKLIKEEVDSIKLKIKEILEESSKKCDCEFFLSTKHDGKINQEYGVHAAINRTKYRLPKKI